MPEKRIWVVRAGAGNFLAEDFRKSSRVSIGWSELGQPLANFPSRAALKEAYRKAYPDDSGVRAGGQTGQLWRFGKEISSGDFVLTPVQPTREVMLGSFEGDYEYKPKEASGYPHCRKVRWVKTVSRDFFSSSFRASLGSTLTVFDMTYYLGELESILQGKPIPEDEAPPEEETSFYDETRSKAEGLISDLIDKLEPYDFQDLVAGVIESLGYRAKSSARGPDGGVDVVAHTDALGLGEDVVKAQVKHRKGQVSRPELQSFLGALRSGDKGLFVSTGGFTKEADREADKSEKKVRLLNREEFVEMLLENYDRMPPAAQALIPLKKVFLPTR